LPRNLIVLLVVVLGLIVALALIYGDTLAFYGRLFQAYSTARRFYGEYPHLVKDVAFDSQLGPRLDVYSPETGDNYPVLVFVHGGSWKDYDKKLFAPVAMRLLPLGMVVVIPNYTLHPDAGYEQMATELAAALRWTLEEIQNYGGDPQRVILAGHSAGGHLSGLVLMDPRFLGAYGHSSDEICGWIGLSGVYDVRAEYDYWANKGPEPKVILEVMGGEQHFTQASPITHIRADLPPILLIHGDEDRTVPVEIAMNLQEALESAGAQSQLNLYRNAGHSDFLFRGLADESAPIVTDIADFVQACGR
jgi:acetyl esterase/lipase